MDKLILLVSILINYLVIKGDGVSLQEQYNHIARRRLQSQGFIDNFIPSRRSEFLFDPHETSAIIGVPGLPSHLPEAEPILPGHTLLRPALGMLKSAIKFPHRDLENGAGVLGNIDNLGLRWDGRNERVLYTDFRRMPNNNGFRRMSSYTRSRRTPADYFMVIPSEVNSKSKPSFEMSPVVVDLDRTENIRNIILKRLKKLNKRAGKNLVIYVSDISGMPKLFNKKNNKKGYLADKLSYYLGSGENVVSANNLRCIKRCAHEIWQRIEKGIKNAPKEMMKLFAKIGAAFIK